MFKRLKRRMSVQLSRKPGRFVLLVILLLNIVFLVVSAAIIDALALNGTQEMSFWRAAFYTVTMVLDAGCIDYVVADIGTTGVVLVIVCLAVIIIGMVLFTGAVIGYLTNYISGFIQNANLGSHKLYLSDHTVILNWNSRASEIVNDLAYCDTKQYAVILVHEGKEEVEKEVQERLADTVTSERAAVRAQAASLPAWRRPWYRLRHKFRPRVVVIVREGDTFSTKQLSDVSIGRAKSIVILGNDTARETCRYAAEEQNEQKQKGRPLSLKALMQVADLTSSIGSADNQKIVVEVEDDWTYELVEKIIANKQVDSKCRIIPVRVNNILGRLLSQFSLMPELNMAYRELFSNKGATFYSKPYEGTDEAAFTRAYLDTHLSSIPLALMEDKGKTYAFYSANSERDDARTTTVPPPTLSVKLNYDYRFERKNVVILGHNGKIRDIMEGFNSFRDEWNTDGREIMNVLVIDDAKHLEKTDYYRDYSYVVGAVAADIYDRALICDTVEKFVDANEGDTSVLILSDDAVPAQEIDVSSLTYLIYIRDIIRRKKEENPDFDEGKIDVVVEILNPKHYDVVKNYSVYNVVISNRYISKMMTQLGEKDVLFEFYRDILTYDDVAAGERDSKEIYIKSASAFFTELPPPCSAADLIRAVYAASADPPVGLPNHTLLLGYVTPSGAMTLFCGDQSKQFVALDKADKLIMLSNH